MSTTKDVRALALELPHPERAELARDLLASLDGPFDDPADVEAAWLGEVERRLKEVEDGTATLVEWDEVRAEVLARLRKR
jgi:putative addiction module component (TIGR02574 family)